MGCSRPRCSADGGWPRHNPLMHISSVGQISPKSPSATICHTPAGRAFSYHGGLCHSHVQVSTMPSLCRPLALATALVCTPGANAGHASHDIVDVLVTASQLGAAPPTARIDGQALQARRPATSDSAALLRGIPGISLYGAGGVSSLPAIRGLGDDRLRI